MKKVIMLLTLVFSSVSSATIVEWSIAEGGNGHLYEVVSALESISWADARDASISLGGHLATITSAEENDFVFNLCVTSEDSGSWSDHWQIWLGGFQPDGSLEPDGNWQWITGEPFVYTNWAAPGPSNSGSLGEDRLTIGYLNSWNDIYNSHSFMSTYIVETIPEPCSLILICGGCLFLRKRK